MNEVLFFVTVAVNFTGILIAYGLFKEMGLFAWIAFATISANIEVVKCVDIFGLPVTLGNVIYGTLFLATDILSEIYGGKEARKGVFIGFAAMIVFTALSQLNLHFIPNENDTASAAMQTIFWLTPRICFASMVSYLISNTLDTFTYDFIRRRLPNDGYLWVRNNGSTMTSQMIDSIAFTWLAFGGMFAASEMWLLCMTTYALKLIVAVCDTPFLYIAKKMRARWG